jgi:hypothetical protein
MSKETHEDAIREMLKGIFHEDWMEPEDWEEFERRFFANNNTTMKGLSDAVHLAVKAGKTEEEAVEGLRKAMTGK